MRKNILPRKLAKPIEQLSDGTWIIRYAIQSIDRTDNEGNELVTFASSIFLEKPTLEMIKKSIHRYAMSVLCGYPCSHCRGDWQLPFGADEAQLAGKPHSVYGTDWTSWSQ